MQKLLAAKSPRIIRSWYIIEGWLVIHMLLTLFFTVPALISNSSTKVMLLGFVILLIFLIVPVVTLVGLLRVKRWALILNCIFLAFLLYDALTTPISGVTQNVLMVIEIVGSILSLGISLVIFKKVFPGQAIPIEAKGEAADAEPKKLKMLG